VYLYVRRGDWLCAEVCVVTVRASFSSTLDSVEMRVLFGGARSSCVADVNVLSAVYIVCGSPGLITSCAFNKLLKHSP